VALIAKITGLPTMGAQIEDYLDKKSCEKEIVEMFKEQFGIYRGNGGIFLRDIKNQDIRFINKLTDCNILRKRRKEEAPTGFIAVTAQCMKGVMFSWVPYLLNQFLINCIDTKDNGTEFHYSWLIILIALPVWGEQKFSSFLEKM
jgi:hypothetical protein